MYEWSASHATATDEPTGHESSAGSASRWLTTRPAAVSTWNWVYIPRYTTPATVPSSSEPRSDGVSAGDAIRTHSGRIATRIVDPLRISESIGTTIRAHSPRCATAKP